MRLNPTALKQFDLGEFKLERAGSRQDWAKLAGLAGMPEDALLELVKLADLVRASYVGPVWARIFYDAGVDTLEKLAAGSPEEGQGLEE